jgi:predicted Zn-ribbon and HTH transcriptional regulator
MARVAAATLLGVSVSATPEQIRQAFRTKSKDAHPDKGGSSERFAALKSAQELLLGPPQCSNCGAPSQNGECDRCVWVRTAPWCTICQSRRAADPSTDVCVLCRNPCGPKCIHCDRQVPKRGDFCRACGEPTQATKDRIAAFAEQGLIMMEVRDALRQHPDEPALVEMQAKVKTAVSCAERMNDLRYHVGPMACGDWHAAAVEWRKVGAVIRNRLTRLRKKRPRDEAPTVAPAELQKRRKTLLKRRERASTPEAVAEVEKELQALDAQIAEAKGAAVREHLREASGAVDELEAEQKRHADAVRQITKRLRTAHAAASA